MRQTLFIQYMLRPPKGQQISRKSFPPAEGAGIPSSGGDRSRGADEMYCINVITARAAAFRACADRRPGSVKTRVYVFDSSCL